jgi:hypothetical protein
MQPKPTKKGEHAMTQTYTAHFYTEADWAETTIKAATPQLALQRAREIDSEQTETLDFQSYDSGAGVEHIEIRSADGLTVAEWQNEDLLLRLAARDLFEALKFCDMTLADLEASKRKGYIAEAKKLARAALAKVPTTA